MKLPGVMIVDFEFCQYGMKSKGRFGEATAKKRTKIMINSVRLAQGLLKSQCTKDHRHAPLINYTAGLCQGYIDEFCDEICQAVKEETIDNADGDRCKVLEKVLQTIANINVASPAGVPSGSPKDFAIVEKHKEMQHPHDDLEGCRGLCQGINVYDDVCGRPLHKDLAAKVPKLEMDFFKEMKVFSKVDRPVAKQLGAKTITARWVDASKGDEVNPDYRARPVRRAIKIHQRPDLFVATPPPETLRMMLSMRAPNQYEDEPCHTLSSDMKRAYCFAKANGPIFNEIPVEDREEGDEAKVERLNLSLYGSRGAAMNWQDEFTQTLVSHGLLRGKASPCNFHHPYRQLSVAVRGDDFTSTGPKTQFRWFEELLNKAYECKHHWLGPDDDEGRSIRVLNRVICWDDECIAYEADSRHVEVVLKQLQLNEARSVSTPGTREEQAKSNDESSEEMRPEDASTYRMIIVHLNYLAMDRPDIQHATKEAASTWHGRMCIIGGYSKALAGILLMHLGWYKDSGGRPRCPQLQATVILIGQPTKAHASQPAEESANLDTMLLSHGPPRSK